MLRGEQGFQRKEIDKLLEWLRTEPKFDVINLPYTLLIGLAEPLRRELGTPICCTLQGEDLFLDGLGEPWRQQSLDLIRAASAHVDLFLPVSRYYLDYMPGFLGIPREKMRMVPLGINTDGYGPRASRPPGPFTIGYFARVAPEKGLHVLAEAYRRLRARPDVGESRLVAAGYLAPEHRGYFDRIVADLRSWGLGGSVRVSWRGRSAAEDRVPARPRRALGADAVRGAERHVPAGSDGERGSRGAAAPRRVSRGHRARPAAASSSSPTIPKRWSTRWLDLWRNPERAAAIGAAGVRGVREHYTVDRMAESVERIYAELAGSGRSRAAS